MSKSDFLYKKPIALTFFILSLIALAFPLLRSKKIKKQYD